MANRLSNLELREVSLVDVGANEGAKVVLYKRAEDLEKENGMFGWLKTAVAKIWPTMPMTTQQLMECDEAEREWSSAVYAFQRSVESIMAHPMPDMGKMLSTSVKEFSAIAAEILPVMMPVSMEKAASALTDLAVATALIDPSGAHLTSAQTSAIEKSINALAIIPRETLSTEVIKNKGDDPMGTTEIIDKSGLEAIQKKLDETVAKMADLEKRAVEAEKKAAESDKEIAKANEIAKGEVEKRRLMEFTKQAETEYPLLPGKPKEKGSLLKALADKLTPEEFKQVEALLASGQAFASKSHAFSVVGRDGIGASGGAYDKVRAMAKERVSKGLAPTEAQAIDTILREDKELATQVLAEESAA